MLRFLRSLMQKKPATSRNTLVALETLEDRYALSTLVLATNPSKPTLSLYADGQSNTVKVSYLKNNVANPMDDEFLVTQSDKNGTLPPVHVKVWQKFDDFMAPIKRINFFGGAGADTFENNTDFYCVAHGGGGKDTLRGGTKSDDLWGDGGNDTLEGRGGSDILIGGEGSDTLRGGAEMDFLYGDYFQQQTGKATGKEGDDTLEGGTGDDFLYGNYGKDLLRGQEGADTLFGESGEDFMYGGIGADKMYGGDGLNRMWGDEPVWSSGDRADQMFGGSGLDVMYGGGGDDVMWGYAFSDWLFGEDGNDKIYAGDGMDMAWGGAGDDRIEGGKGDDMLWGDDGADTLFGQSGDDHLHAGDDSKKDFLYGGWGWDTVFMNKNDHWEAYPGPNPEYHSGDDNPFTLDTGAFIEDEAVNYYA
jgi:Ca2+-binding RTX toxin-like protein